MNRMRLSVAEIYDLACAAGFVIHHGEMFMPDADEMETEITIIDCPKDGVEDDDGKHKHYAHIAYFTEYPDEGCYPLGAELPKPHNPDEDQTAGKPWPIGLDSGRMGVTPNAK